MTVTLGGVVRGVTVVVDTERRVALRAQSLTRFNGCIISEGATPRQVLHHVVLPLFLTVF